jgi:arylsulfatase A-like enzyme
MAGTGRSLRVRVRRADIASGRGEARRNQGGSLDVLVIVADALRRDALDIERSDGSPLRLRQRFGSWLWFEHYYASAPWTLPSTTSLLTGADAARHGHWEHGHALAVPSLVSAIRDRRRIAIVNNSVLDPTSGLDAGFDEYHCVADSAEFWGRSHEILEARMAARESYFLMLHSNVVHDYYLPIARTYFERHIGPAGSSGYFDLRWRVLSWADISPVQRPVVRRIYDACVLELDERVDALLDVVDLDRTVVVFTSDHGEGFEPVLARIHHAGRMHDDVLRVPCVMHLPSSVSTDVRATLEAARSRTIGTVDLVPTLLDLVGARVDAPDGRSFASTAYGVATRRVARAQDDRYLYLANRLRLNINLTGKNMGPAARLRNRIWHRTAARTHRLRAYVDDPYKLVVSELQSRARWLARAASPLLRRRHNGRPAVVVDRDRWFGVELFDRDRDPRERTNLLRTRADALAALELAAACDAGDITRSLAVLAQPRGVAAR